jgi:acetyl esterase/lipase
MTLRLSSPTKMHFLSKFLSFSAVLLGVVDHLLFMVEGVKVSYGEDDRQFIEVYPCKHVNAGNSKPLLVFLHGGAWYSGSTTDHHDLAHYISTESDISVVLIEYRLTLEGNKIHHPDHLEDVYQALDLIFRQSTASRFGYNTSKSIFAGHSVGGYMVNAAALASDQGQSSYTGPIRSMPKLDKEIRQAIKAFVAVVSAFIVCDYLTTSI